MQPKRFLSEQVEHCRAARSPVSTPPLRYPWLCVDVCSPANNAFPSGCSRNPQKSVYWPGANPAYESCTHGSSTQESRVLKAGAVRDRRVGSRTAPKTLSQYRPPEPPPADAASTIATTITAPIARATTRVFLQLQPLLLSDVSICNLRSARVAAIDSVAAPGSCNAAGAAELPIEFVIYITEPRGGPGRTRDRVRIAIGPIPVPTLRTSSTSITMGLCEQISAQAREGCRSSDCTSARKDEMKEMSRLLG